MVNFVNKILSIKPLLFILTFALAWIYFGSGSFAISGAPSNIFPDASPAGYGPTYTVVQISNQPIKMKARSTIASIYVPEAMAGANIGLVIEGGCDNGPASGRDYKGWTANTEFSVGFTGGYATSDTSCVSGVTNDVTMNFIANPAAAPTSHDGYYIFRFVANALGSEAAVGATANNPAGSDGRYLNAFRVIATTPGIFVGIANWDAFCNKAAFPNSCPTERTSTSGYGSYVYSSLYGTNNPYAFQIPMRNRCATTGDISFYDLDANDPSLGQNINIRLYRNGVLLTTNTPSGPIDHLPHLGITNWTGGVPGVLVAHPGFGGNEDQYLDIPGGDPMFTALGNFEANVDYTLLVTGISSNNALQIKARLSNCPSPVQPTCTITGITNAVGSNIIFPGQQLVFTVATSNADGYVMGVNGPTADPAHPNDPAWGVYPNYLVSGNQYIRTPIPGNTPSFSVSLYSYVDGGPYNQGFYAPNTPGTYNFSWGIVRPNVGWSANSCSGSFVVQQPDYGICESADVTSGPIIAGTAFTTRIRYRNIGGTTWVPGIWNLGSHVGLTNNYLTNGGGQIRGATVSGPIVPGDRAEFNVTQIAPGTPGTYPYYWLMVHEGVAWFGPGQCGLDISVINRPDTRPSSVSIGQGCSAPNYVISIRVDDPDRATNGLRPMINYSLNGGPTQSVRATAADGSITIPMPDPLTAVTVLANSNGIMPNPPGGDGPASSNVSSNGGVAQRFDPCAFSFTVQPLPDGPILENDNENPVQARFTTRASIVSTAPRVNGLRAEREFFVNRGGTYNEAAGTVTGVGSCGLAYGATPAVEVQTGLSLSVKSPLTEQIMTTTVRQLTNPPYPGCFFWTQPFRAGDYVCIREDIFPRLGWVDRSNNIIPSSLPLDGEPARRKTCSSVNDTAYLRAYGGDVYAGAGFGATCTNTANDIRGYGRQAGTSWIGSGSQLGVFASGTISQFASRSLVSNSRTSDLTFSNVSPALGSMGGRFGSTFCSDDFWSSKNPAVTQSVGAPPALQTLGSGQYQYAAGSTISAAAPIANRIAVYIDGDVTITGNGITTSTSWASVTEIPSVYVVVRGNIYVAPTVTQLDGIYVAQPNAASPLGGGRIFTCTDNGASPTAVALNTTCRTKLTVNGALVATKVNFMRTTGSLRNGIANEPYTSPNISEVIRYTPEMMLARPAGAPKTKVGTFDSVVSLPPSL